MDHVAIMNKKWGLIPKILSGQKKIESRWGINKCAPWGKLKVGERVYFKNAGESLIVVSTISKILEFENTSETKVKHILEKYGKQIAINNLEESIKWAQKKRYCTLIYLKDSKKIKPFNINKSGFGIGAAWLSVKKISDIVV